MTTTKDCILLVDDEHVNLTAYSRLFTKAGYEVLTAATGSEAFALLERRQPDIVLLDIVLANESGLDILRTLKSDLRFQHMYVVIISGQAKSSDDQATGLELGADGYVTRPIANRELLARIDAFMRHKHTLDTLRTSEARFRKIIERNPDAMLIVDRQGRIQFANPAAETLFALPRDDLLRCVFGFPIIAGEHTEIEIVRPDNADIVGEMRTITIEWDGAPSFLTSVRDITRRKIAEGELLRNSEKLEQTVAERTRELREAQDRLVRREKLAVLGQMAGSVGHELRTPLSTISNAVYYLAMVLGEPEEQIADYLDIIRSQTHRAEKIIADLLDFSRVKSLNRQEIRVVDVVTLVLEKYAPSDAIQVVIDIPGNLPAIVADPMHVDQVLSNLVMNAYQAMPQGGTLTISAHNDDDMVAIDVSDTGSGIAPEHLDKLFEPLFTTKPKGIGLGLAVCKNLIEANGGAITVESKEHEETTFTVTLPLKEEV
jgi:signal transduction histidine kinase